MGTKIWILIWIAQWGIVHMMGQTPLSRDSLLTLAIQHNRKLLVAKEQLEAAQYERKAAKTNFLPKLSATGTYMYNQKTVSLLSKQQQHDLNHMGDRLLSVVENSFGQLGDDHPVLTQLIGPLAAIDIATPLNELGHALTEALQTDTRHIWAGGVSLTQPLYMGGKIRAYYRLTQQAEALAHSQWETEHQAVIDEVERTYWLVVSLSARKELATEYLHLVQTLEEDVSKMHTTGVATLADELTVKVKMGEAEMAMTEVSNGLNLSRMLLCQLCGLEPDTTLHLADEGRDSIAPPPLTIPSQGDIDFALTHRPELKSLEAVVQMNRQNERITRAGYLPTLALTGNYLVSNPSVLNGFERKFRGTWNVGILLNIPLFQWGEGVYKTRESHTQTLSAEWQLIEAREEITLQVHQCKYRLKEAHKQLALTESNRKKAEENLRYARLGFHEGVTSTTQVMEAQTAWLSAHVACIDAQIGIRLAETEMRKAMGEL